MLDDPERRNEIDRNGMLGILSSLPEQLEEGMALCRTLRITPPTKGRLVAFGMGGSAIAGDIGAALAWREGYPVIVLRDYQLPSFIGNDDLLVFLSYSGNTWETLSSYQEALRRGHQCFAVSSGGELQQIASASETPHLQIPKGLPPRGALGYLLAPLLAVLSVPIPALREGVKEAITFLARRRERWAPAVPTRENEAKALALALRDKTPIIYSPPSLQCVARRWQTQLNENAKVLAWNSSLPEAGHNEIVGWMQDARVTHFAPIVLRAQQHERMERQIAEITSMMEERLTVQTVRPSQADYLSQLLELILLGDLMSLYLAIANGVDPFPVEPISRLKAALRSSAGRAL